MEIERIKQICCTEFNLTELKLNDRKRVYCFPNQVAQYLTYISNPHISMEKIGKEYNKSVGLIYRSIKNVERLMSTNKKINNKIKLIIEKYGIKDRKNRRRFITT
jgi:chromosomal replication initiation ATPase DnaA